MSFFSEQKVTIVGAPFNGGQGKTGVEKGPALLEDLGLAEALQALGWKTKWDHLKFDEVENDPVTHNMRRPKYVSAACKKLYDHLLSVPKDEFVLTVGGDHSIGISTIMAALQRHPDSVVLWIDAHADLNTPAASLSGNLHGCPVSFLAGLDGLGELGDNTFDWLPERRLALSRLAYIGLRDVDEFEKKVIRDNNIAAYSMHEIDRYGIARVMEMALERINPGMTRPIHLSFDVDALDPFFAPSTGTPVRGGLTMREGAFICEVAAETGKLVSMDMVEVNPVLAENEFQVQATVRSAIAVTTSALGHRLL